jgi:hypothetical protein
LKETALPLELKELAGRFLDHDMQKSVLKIETGQEVVRMNQFADGADSLHLEMSGFDVLIERFEVEHWSQIAGLLGDCKEI